MSNPEHYMTPKIAMECSMRLVDQGFTPEQIDVVMKLVGHTSWIAYGDGAVIEQSRLWLDRQVEREKEERETNM